MLLRHLIITRIDELWASDFVGGHDSQDAANVVCKETEGGNFGISRETQLETIELPKNKKLRESNPGNVFMQSFLHGW